MIRKWIIFLIFKNDWKLVNKKIYSIKEEKNFFINGFISNMK